MAAIVAEDRYRFAEKAAGINRIAIIMPKSN